MRRFSRPFSRSSAPALGYRSLPLSWSVYRSGPVRSWSALSGPGQPCPGSSGQGRPACRAHIGRVPDRAGGYHGRPAVLVKPNGRLGSLYMLGIKPFRYLGVYPALLRSIGREWQENAERRAAA
ncbi:DUF2867 domain-containing protein [Streptomyces anulatus]|uniref:DUF2867 domain-containing protein n=1 Tax=Streptomyces anulatus TaxID=1892 RepID=UPI0036DD80FE